MKFTMQKRIIFGFLVCGIIMLFLCQCGPSITSKEPHTKNVIDSILLTRDKIEAKIPKESRGSLYFVSFWDFDGTILKGDCSEGYRVDDKVVYKGLIEIAIDRGYSREYRPGQFESFWKEYMRIDTQEGHLQSIKFIPRIFAGTDIHDMLQLSENHMSNELSGYYFASSMDIIRYLQHEGILIYVVSASPDFFVKGSAKSLKVQMEHFYGVKTKIIKGKITTDIQEPVTYAEGKTKTVQHIIENIKTMHNTSHVYTIAGFGNSYHTDGEFLKWIASQSLPAGKANTIMINGGDEPAKYRGLFEKVIQDQVVDNH